MKAVITAGGRIDGPFARQAGTEVKALAVIHSRTMLARMIDALRTCGATRIAVVGGDEVRGAVATSVELVVEESPSGSENLVRALRAWPEDGTRLLYATSDLPYVTAVAVADFMERAGSDEVALPLIEHAAYAARFPDAPEAGITLAGVRVVNGGVFSIPAGATAPLAGVATRFFEARKKPWRMASLVNPTALLQFVLGRLTIEGLEATATRALRFPAKAVRRCAPELAFDVDGLAEYEYARAHD